MTAACFRDDPDLAGLHPLRGSGAAPCIWQTFDGLDMSDPAGVALDDVLAVLKPGDPHRRGAG
ncbi:hypothetical protein [Streptomyces bobili]|uniref:hypothetical protein n=1 Tax=Streptomyces bobili TaxID=67280 RepID=UPI0037168D74